MLLAHEERQRRGRRVDAQAAAFNSRLCQAAHHDGGEEENLAKLDSTLAAADLMICQTGCISHNAYWRVKDHCKRTGKPCLFVENTGTASVKRALSALQPAAAA